MTKDSERVTICVVSTAHSPVDDRIYFKEVQSLAKFYKNIVMVMPEDPESLLTNSSVKLVPLNRPRSISGRLLLIPKIMHFLVKLQPTVCHFHDFEFIFALPFLRFITSCKFIYDVHESFPEMMAQSRKFPSFVRPVLGYLVDLFECWLSQFAHAILAADDNIAHKFRRFHENVTTIFNYPNLSLFVADERARLKLEKHYNGRTAVIYEGGFSVERGLFKMIEAMRYVKAARPDVILLLVGKLDDQLRLRAEQEIARNQLEQNIDIVGWVPHEKIVNYISYSKLGLVPLQPNQKFFKNIPIKQFEYMACGVPVIGANLPPIAFYINEGQCGQVFDSTDSKSMADAVLRILNDEVRRIRMSKAGRLATRDRWNWSEMEKRLYSVYQQLIAAC